MLFRSVDLWDRIIRRERRLVRGILRGWRTIRRGRCERKLVTRMKTREFQKQVDESQVVRAIQEAESRTSGEIRVLITRHVTSDPVADARTSFHRLGMDRTTDRNGVLILIAPESRSFAVFGDDGIHSRVPDGFWGELAQGMASRCRAGEFTAAIVGAVEQVAKILRRHFPRADGGTNELPDAIVRDD